MRNLFTLMLLFIGSINLSFAQCPPSTTPGVHVVQSKENLYRIAQAYKVSMGDICKWNNMKVDDVLPVCKELIISAPYMGAVAPQGKSNPIDDFTTRGGNSAIYQNQGKKHTVRSGETLAGIANLYGFTEKKFRSINAMKDDQTLTPGSTLLTTECACEVVNTDTYSAPSLSDNGTFRDVTTPHVPNPNRSNINPQPHTSPHKNLSSRSNDTTSKGSGSAAAPYMKQVEYTMVEEINLLRGNPQGYIKYVEQYRKEKKKVGYPVPDATVDELIAELRNTPKLSILQPSECIYRTARNHGEDIRRMGKSGHKGTDGSWPWDRVKKTCPDFQDGNENLVGGPALVRESIMLLLIDHGISSRGHRKTLLNPHWTHVGTYKIGQVGQMPNSWVQNFGQMAGGASDSHTNTSPTKPTIHNANRFTPKGNTYEDRVAHRNAKAPQMVSNASYMKSVENDMMHEINLMRSNPAGYIQYVKKYRADKRAIPGYPVPEATIDELISELKNTRALSILQPSNCVYNAASNHGQDILRMGKSGHQGTDGSWPWDRVKRACTSFQDGNENLVGGPADVREAVILLLIDDGISSRGHRRTLMNPKWTHVACYNIGQVGQMPNCWVQQFGQE